MRILYLTEEPITFSGTMVRGGQIHVRNVITGLQQKGHEVHLIDWNSEPEKEFQHSLIPQGRFVLDPLRTVRHAYAVGVKSDIDIVISKTRKTYLPGLLAARLLGVPHIVHVGSSPRPISESFVDRVDNTSAVSRIKAPHDGYFVVCDAISRDLQELGIAEENIFNVKNAVNTTRFCPNHAPTEMDEEYRQQIEKHVDDESFVVGFIGGLHSYKGLNDLSEAVRNIKSECRIILAGEGPERERLQEEIGDQAVFLGAVPYGQIPALYQQIDSLVLPSHTEGLPRVILEAQASGVPVIATKVGGIPEVIDDGKNGLLIQPRSPSELTTAIDKLANNKELRSSLADQGRQSVVKSYSWQDMYERYEQYLDDILGKPRSD